MAHQNAREYDQKREEFYGQREAAQHKYGSGQPQRVSEQHQSNSRQYTTDEEEVMKKKMKQQLYGDMLRIQIAEQEERKRLMKAEAKASKLVNLAPSNEVFSFVTENYFKFIT